MNDEIDDHRGMEWWNSLSKADRYYWLNRANSSRPVEAWLEYKRSMSERYRYEDDAENGL